MRSRPLVARALVVLLLLAVPAAWGHGEDQAPPSTPTPGRAEAAEPSFNDGYTGPGREPYLNYFQGVWVYGQVVASPLGDQSPRGIRGDGEWLVWEDAKRGDVYLHNIAAGTGFYIKQDASIQRSPDISDGVVVWEDYSNKTGSDVVAYFIGSGETRVLSRGTGNDRNPRIDGSLVAWENDRNRTIDILAYDLTRDEEIPIATTSDRESDPLVHDGIVYHRTFRFNVWDVFATDAATGEQWQVTSDVEAQGRPFTNGTDVLFLTQRQGGWQLDAYRPDERIVRTTALRLGDASPTPAEGQKLLAVARDAGRMQVLARNITSGSSQHVSAGFLLTTDPWLQSDTAYLSVRTENGTSLLSIRVSPFAWSERPTLTIGGPPDGTRWGHTLTVQGILRLPSQWVEPATFTYRIDDEPPVALPPTARFRFVADPLGFEPGRHTLTVRATFREGPALEESILLIVPSAQQALDVEKLGERYHSLVVASTLQEFIFTNPLSFALIVLVILLVLVLLVRFWLILRPRRRRVRVEYVPPE